MALNFPNAPLCTPLIHATTRYSIRHTMTFSYGGTVQKNRNVVRLCPKTDAWQKCESFVLQTDPPSNVSEQFDQFGNRTHRFEIKDSHRCLALNACSVVSMTGLANNLPPDSRQSAATEHSVPAEMARYSGLSAYIPHAPEIEALAQGAERESGGSTAGLAEAAARLIRLHFRYRPGVTTAASTIADVFKTRAGVCQDFAHLLIAVLRWRGVAGRYVSGYVAPEHLADPLYKGDRLFRTAAGHAWVEFFLPIAGWVAIDPTLGVWPGARHVQLACGRDYGDASPIFGAYQGAEQSSVQSMIEISTLPGSPVG